MTNGNTEAFTEMANEWQKTMMDSWATWTKATVGSDAFAQTSASMMDWNLATQKKMQDITGQYLETLDLPRRSDLARLSEQVLSVEKRVADGEDDRDDIKEQLQAVESKLDKMMGMVESLAATLEASQAQAAEEKTSAPKSKAKTTKKSKSSK